MKNKPRSNVIIRSIASRQRFEFKPAPLTYNLSLLLEEIAFIPMIESIFHSNNAWAGVVTSELKKQFTKYKIDDAIKFENEAYSHIESHAKEFDATITYLSVLRAFTKIFQDRYHQPEFATIRENKIGLYREGIAAIEACIVRVCQRHIEVRYRECQYIHSAFHQVGQAPAFSAKEMKRVSELYHDIEAAYQCANKVFLEQEDVNYLAEYRYHFLRTHIEALISKVRFINNNKKSHLGDIRRCYDEIKAVSAAAGGVMSKIQLLNLKARIALNWDNNLGVAIDCANKIDFHLSTFALNLNFKEEELIAPFSQNTLIKLGIYVKNLKSSKLMDLSALIDIVSTLLSARGVISQASEVIQSELLMLTDRMLAYQVSVTCTFLNTSDIDLLNNYTQFTDLMLQLLDAYESLLPQYCSMTIQKGWKTYRDRLVSVKQSIETRVEALTREEQANQKRYAELQLAIENYNAEFDNLLKQFEAEAKQNPPMHIRGNKPHFTLPTTSRVESKVADVSPVAPQMQTLSEYARAYFDWVPSLEAIEALVEMVPPEARSEALLYIGDEYLLNLRLGSALTFYERALDEHGIFSARDHELLTAIELSLADASEKLAKQIEYGTFYRDKAKADRDNFIISLGFKAHMRDNPGKKVDFRDLAMREKMHELGLPIFQKIGEQKRAQHLPVSKKTKIARDIEMRLGIFLQNQQTASRLMDKARDAKVQAELTFPSLAESSLALFQPAKNSLSEPQEPQLRRLSQ